MLTTDFRAASSPLLLCRPLPNNSRRNCKRAPLRQAVWRNNNNNNNKLDETVKRSQTILSHTLHTKHAHTRQPQQHNHNAHQTTACACQHRSSPPHALHAQNSRLRDSLHTHRTASIASHDAPTTAPAQPPPVFGTRRNSWPTHHSHSSQRTQQAHQLTACRDSPNASPPHTGHTRSAQQQLISFRLQHKLTCHSSRTVQRTQQRRLEVARQTAPHLLHVQTVAHALAQTNQLALRLHKNDSNHLGVVQEHNRSSSNTPQPYATPPST